MPTRDSGPKDAERSAEGDRSEAQSVGTRAEGIALTCPCELHGLWWWGEEIHVPISFGRPGFAVALYACSPRTFGAVGYLAAIADAE